MRLSTSFSEEEVAFLDGLLRVLLRGGDASMFVRHHAFASVMKKVIAMKEKVANPGIRGVKAKLHVTDEVGDMDEKDYDPEYSEGNQLGALNPGEAPDEGD